MALERERRVLFLGPPNAGATTLIATLPRALERNAHGFAARDRFLFDPEPEPSEGRRSLADLARSHGRGAAPDADDRGLIEYEALIEPLAASWGGVLRRRPATPARAVLIDMPGRTLLASRSRPGGDLDAGGALHDQLERAHGLVVVWPIDRVADRTTANDPSHGWSAALAALASRRKAAVCPALDTVVVAFSCFDRELAAMGARAAEAALDFAYVRGAIAASLRRNPALAHAVAAMTRWTREVDLMAASSFGVIGGYGETNWDMGAGEVLIDGAGGGKLGSLFGGARKSALPAELDESWLPLFAADPVIRCVLGRRHGLMIPARELLAAAP